MSTQEEARKAMAESRKHEEHIRENLVGRSQAEIQQSLNREISEEARETTAKHRQHEKHIRETVLSRSEAEIKNSKI